jgi:Tfp pilus assembly protein PilF
MQMMAARKFVKPDATTPTEEKNKRQVIEQVTQQVRMEVIKSDRKIETEHHLKVAEQFFQLAQEKFAEGDYWKVAQLCKQALKNNPTEARYYHLMATAYAQHPRFGKDAEQCFCKALEMDPWNSDYHLDLAVFYFQHHLTKRALSECQKALQIAPQNEKAKRLLSKITKK